MIYIKLVNKTANNKNIKPELNPNFRQKLDDLPLRIIIHFLKSSSASIRENRGQKLVSMSECLLVVFNALPPSKKPRTDPECIHIPTTYFRICIWETP
jgi:hypothetical protein